MISRVALRRLSSVEVDPGASHQREFHANALRREFGFPAGETAGRLLAVYFPANADPLCDDTGYTLYDSRKPPRTEYHLYPKTRLFLEHANAGDLLGVFRSGSRDDLCILVAERGCAMEKSLLATCFPTGIPPLQRFTFPDQNRRLDPGAEHQRVLMDLAQSLDFDLT